MALGLLGSGAAYAGFSTTKVQQHYGGGYKMGSNATFGSGFSEETDRATVTLEHFSTNDIGDQSAGVDSQIVFSSQIRWDLGDAMGRPAARYILVLSIHSSTTCLVSQVLTKTLHPSSLDLGSNPLIVTRNEAGGSSP